MFRDRIRRQREVTAELNITAFMNLMVVLVPFLLITAVFSQLAVLQINLPGSAEQTEQQEPPRALEVIVRQDRFEVGERQSGSIQMIPKKDGQYDFDGLNEALQSIKAHPAFDSESAVTLLLEENTDYDTLIHTMDAVRLVEQENPEKDELGNDIHGELFPNISLGSAPPDERNLDQTLAGGAR